LVLTSSLLKDILVKTQFVTIIGKFDHLIGPVILYSSVQIGRPEFIRDLLKDALHTNNKFVILDHGDFYSQVCKTEIDDPSARGQKQLYGIILLRSVDHPIIPTKYFEKIETLFKKIGRKKILSDKKSVFNKFSIEIFEFKKN